MSVSIDQQFVEFVVKSLVSNPDAVSINRTIDEKGVLLELTVAPEDLGRVIGKRGGTAQSIRTLLRALGTKNEARYNLKIVDTDGGSGATQSRLQTEAASSDDTTQVNLEDSNPVEEDETEIVENGSSEYEEKHRKDLADLDDLDI
jgi:predicted RNA-binding protein YlqC (UPF0109 family)